jgi:hypothetical protein
MIHDDHRDRPPFNRLWLSDQYAFEVDQASELLDPPHDFLRTVITELAHWHPHWTAAQIKLEIERPTRRASYGIPPHVEISEVAIQVVLDLLRRR